MFNRILRKLSRSLASADTHVREHVAEAAAAGLLVAWVESSDFTQSLTVSHCRYGLLGWDSLLKNCWALCQVNHQSRHLRELDRMVLPAANLAFWEPLCHLLLNPYWLVSNAGQLYIH